MDRHPLAFPWQAVEESPSQILTWSNHDGNINPNSWTKSCFNGSTRWTLRLYLLSEVVIYWAVAVGGEGELRCLTKLGIPRELNSRTSEMKIYIYITYHQYISHIIKYYQRLPTETLGLAFISCFWLGAFELNEGRWDLHIGQMYDQPAQVGTSLTLELWSRCWVLDCLCCRLLDPSQA